MNYIKKISALFLSIIFITPVYAFGVYNEIGESLFFNGFEAEEPFYLNADGNPAKKGENICGILGMNIKTDGETATKIEGAVKDEAKSGERSLLVNSEKGGGVYSECEINPNVLYKFGISLKTADEGSALFKLKDLSSSGSIYEFNDTMTTAVLIGNGESISVKSNSGWQSFEKIIYALSEESPSPKLSFVSEESLRYYADDMYLKRAFEKIDGSDTINIGIGKAKTESYTLSGNSFPYSELIEDMKWELSEENAFISVDNGGKLTVSENAGTQSVNLRLIVKTKIGTEVFEKQIAVNRINNDYDLGLYDFEIENPVYRFHGDGSVKPQGDAYATFISQYGYSLIQIRPGQQENKLNGIISSEAYSGKKSVSVTLGGYGGGLGVHKSYKKGTLYYYSVYVKGDSESKVKKRKLAFLPLFENGYGAMSSSKLYVYDSEKSEFADQSTAGASEYKKREENNSGLFFNLDSDSQWQKVERAFYFSEDSQSEYFGLSYDGVYNDYGISCYMDDIYTGKLFKEIEGSESIKIESSGEVSESYSVSLASDAFNSIIKNISWSVCGNPDGVSIDGGKLTVSDKVRLKSITISAKIETEAGEETLTKSVSIENTTEFPATTYNSPIVSYDFEIENPVYLKSNGEVAKESEQIFSIKGLNLYPYRAGDNGNQFQGLSSGTAFQGEKSLFVQQGYLGGIYSAVKTLPQALYVYSMYAKPAFDTRDKALKLIDTKSDGKTLMVYSPDLSGTNDGYMYSEGGSSVWNLKSENSGEWEKVERIFYSTKEEAQSRNLAFSANLGSAANDNGCFKFYMDNLCISRAFTGISGQSQISIPKTFSESFKYDLLSFNEGVLKLIKEKSWKVYSQSEGVSIDEKGVLSVSPEAEDQTVTIELEIKTDAGIETFYKNVSLNKKEKADISCYDLNGDEINYSAKEFLIKTHIENQSSEELKYNVIIAMYNESQNALEDIIAINKEVCGANSEKSADYSVKADKLTENSYIKIMVWDNEMKSVAELKLLVKPVKNELFVSADGSDENTGTLEKPFLTLGRAKKEIIKIKNSYGLPNGGITVNIRGGKYYLTETLELDSECSGSEKAPIVWQSYNNEDVRIIGGIKLNSEDFVKETDSEILGKIYEASARDKIYKLDLSQIYLSDIPKVPHLGKFQKIAENSGKLNYTSVYEQNSELFRDGKPLSLAGWPNNGEYAYYDMDDVVNSDSYTKENLKFKYENDRISNWLNAEEHRLYGFWGPEWADWSAELKSYNDGVVEINSTVLYQMTGNRRRFRAYNLIEELDSDGEYYIDRKNKTLYYYSEDGNIESDLTLSTLKDPLFKISGENITVKGLTLGETRGQAISVLGKNNLIENCKISGTPTTAVSITGFNNGICSCLICDVNGGIALNGGNRKDLTAGENYVRNNVIMRFDRLTKPLTVAVDINGVGNIVSHNEIKDAEQIAVRFYGNNHLIEYNEIYNVCTVADDVGAIYSGGDTTFRGNRILNNYIHDLPVSEDNGPNENTGIYFDDQMSSGIVEGNVFENISWRGVQIEGGRNHIVRNNEFINVTYYVYIKDRNPNEDYVDYKNMTSDDSRYSLVSNLKAVPYQSSVWYNSYPELYNILEPFENLGKPWYNTVTNNRYTNAAGIYAPKTAEEYGIFENNVKITERTSDTTQMGLYKPIEIYYE